jgi:hypothetical protein
MEKHMTSTQAPEATPDTHGTGRIDGLIRWGGHGAARPSKKWSRLLKGEEVTFEAQQSVEVVTRDRGYNLVRRTDLRPGAKLTGPLIYRQRRFSGSLKARAHAPLVLVALALATALLAYYGYSIREMFGATRWTKGQTFILGYGGLVLPILLLLWYVFLRSALIERPALRRRGAVEVQTPETLEDPNEI